MKQKLCNGFCAFFKSMYVNPDNRGKKKKKQTKKSLYTTKTLLKNQRQHLVDGWVFYLLPFFAFLLPLLWEGVPLLILGYVGALCRELEIW